MTGTQYGFLNTTLVMKEWRSAQIPILLSSDIAARTKNIRIGQAASIITFWNPISCG